MTSPGVKTMSPKPPIVHQGYLSSTILHRVTNIRPGSILLYILHRMTHVLLRPGPALLLSSLTLAALSAIVYGSERMLHKANLAGGCSYHELEMAIDVYDDCFTILGDVSSAILVLMDSNYTMTCRYFQNYVNCMESTFKCTQIAEEFWKDYKTYTAMPYNCTVNSETILPSVKNIKDFNDFGAVSTASRTAVNFFQYFIDDVSRTSCGSYTLLLVYCSVFASLIYLLNMKRLGR